MPRKSKAFNSAQHQRVANEGLMFRLTSTAFRDEHEIPRQFSCDGENISPQLSWSGVPQGTKSLALIMHDPDAPKAGGTYALGRLQPAFGNFKARMCSRGMLKALSEHLIESTPVQVH